MGNTINLMKDEIKMFKKTVKSGVQDDVDLFDAKIKNISETTDQMLKDMDEIKTRLDTQSSQPSAQQVAGEPLGLHGATFGEGTEDLEGRFEKIRETIIELEGRLQGRISATEDRVIEYKDDVRKNTGGGDKGHRLVNPKDTNVHKLAESFSHADFTNWVEELYMHIEGTTGWSNSTPVLKMVRKEKAPITE